MQVRNLSTISKIYAQALYDTEVDNSVLKFQLSEVLKTVNSSEDLQIVLANSSISGGKKIDIIDEIFKDKIEIHVLNLIKLLIEKNRISELESIYSAFCELDNKSSNKKNVEIISSVNLDDGTKSRIIEKLNKKLNCEILPEWKIDEDIIAGLVFKYDDYVIDTSVLAKLKQLSKQ
jgi:F-type H+-transporting ATPase subunit delta